MGEAKRLLKAQCGASRENAHRRPTNWPRVLIDTLKRVIADEEQEVIDEMLERSREEFQSERT